jgi:hypothetical protein
MRAVIATSAVTSGVVSVLAWVLQGLFTPLISSYGQQLSLWARAPAALDFNVLEQRGGVITFVIDNRGQRPALVDAMAYCPPEQTHFSNMETGQAFWVVARGPDSTEHFGEKVDLLHQPATTDWSVFCSTGQMHRLLPFKYDHGARVVPPEGSVEITFEAVPNWVFMNSRARMNPGVGGFCAGVLNSEGKRYSKILECVHPESPLADPTTVDERMRAAREEKERQKKEAGSPE